MRAMLELQDLDADALVEPRSTRCSKDLHDRAPRATRRRCRCRAASAAAWRSRARWRRSPRFILLDEPFAGVDPIAVIEIQRIIGFLKERGIGVLITDHNVRETLGICDRAYIINEGRGAGLGHAGRDRL